jgi:hypothetical protein
MDTNAKTRTSRGWVLGFHSDDFTGKSYVESKGAVKVRVNFHFDAKLFADAEYRRGPDEGALVVNVAHMDPDKGRVPGASRFPLCQTWNV